MSADICQVVLARAGHKTTFDVPWRNLLNQQFETMSQNLFIAQRWIGRSYSQIVYI